MEFYDVSSWLETRALGTKGTRAKIVLIKPQTAETYFLKFPMVRPNRDYTPENWSEVIAYEVGTALGFNVLRYDLALYNGKIGCISKNMINPENNESLIEGHQILTRFNSSYDPEDKGTYSQYTFDFVVSALTQYGAESYVTDFLKTLVFDAIIGNSDRHQSNWGIIQSQIKTTEDASKFGFPLKFPFSFSKTEVRKNGYKIVRKPAPIYDSGCCLGREFGETQIIEHLTMQSKFDRYIRKGVAELRVREDGGRSTHNELLLTLKRIHNGKWAQIIHTEIQRVIGCYDLNKISELINGIDKPFPMEFADVYGLSSARKEFIIRVIDTRINNLKNI
jgi:hypothetical protein